MKIKAFLYEKNLIAVDAKFIVFEGEEGQTGILPNHAPIILYACKGYLKCISYDDDTNFVYFERGIFQFENNHGVLLASNGICAKTKEEAYNIFLQHQTMIKSQAYTNDIDYSRLERELLENIKAGHAGNL